MMPIVKKKKKFATGKNHKCERKEGEKKKGKQPKAAQENALTTKIKKTMIPMLACVCNEVFFPGLNPYNTTVKAPRKPKTPTPTRHTKDNEIGFESGPR